MKFPQLLFTSFLLLICFQFGFSQEKPQAKLVDEFEELTPDDLQTRLWHFTEELVKDINGKAYIVIYGKKNQPLEKYKQEIRFKGLWDFLRLDPDKLKILHGNDEERLRTQLWIVSENTEVPNFVERNWDYVLPEKTKPFLFHKESWIVEVGVETFSYEFYAKFLLADPRMNGNLVIYEKRPEKFQKTRKKLFKDLVQTFKIPTRQIKTFYIKSNKSDIEFWLVLSKSKP